MQDSIGRQINYLRISVTDRCNLRCIYCMPESGINLIPHSDILNYQEITQIATIGAKLGIKSVRLTGGEPLVRKNLSTLITSLHAIQEITDISLTTNGILLPKYAQELKQAGLNRVNISLDTLNAEKFKKISRIGSLRDCMRGIQVAMQCGFSPVKINVVLLENINTDEIETFINLAKFEPLHIRFIELMPVGENMPITNTEYSSLQSLRNKFEKFGIPTEVFGMGPAKNYSKPGWLGSVGFISSISNSYCSSCNRIRLTADGKLRTCLHGKNEIDIRSIIRNQPEKLEETIQMAIQSKAEHFIPGQQTTDRCMYQIGG